MKEYKRVLKFITDNRQDIDHSSNEHLATQLYIFFYGKDCTTCANELTTTNEGTPCFKCIDTRNHITTKEWSPK